MVLTVDILGFDNLGWMKRRRLRKIAYKWLSDHLKVIDETDIKRVMSELNKFNILILPTSSVEALYPDRWLSRKLGNLSNDIPWEVVGQYEIHLFIHDNENNMMFETSVITMTHGLGHALLYCFDKHRRFKLTIDDLSGNKRGDEVNWFVAAVHNRTNRSAIIQRTTDAEIDNTIYYLQTYREFFPRIWRKVSYRVFDFRDDLR